MGQFLQINGDYNIKTKPGGRITLDAGIGEDSTFGVVEVVGNLVVTGDTTSVTSTNLEIVDRILTLNKGEAGPGVSFPGYSGIEIDRGSLPDSSLAGKAAFVFDEQDSPQIGSEGGSWIIAFGTESGYSFQDSNLKLRRILTDPLTDSGNLTLIANGLGVVSVAGTTNYETQVIAFGDDALTNKKYVDDAILNNPTFQIRSPGTGTAGDTRVIIADEQITVPAGTPGSLAYHFNETGFLTFGESAVSIIVNNSLSTQFYSDRVNLQDLIIVDNEIRADQDIDVYVKTSGTGKLRTNIGMRFDNVIGSNPLPNVDASIIYSKNISTGNTGLYFVSNNTTVGTVTDELISKSRALVYSMLF